MGRYDWLVADVRDRLPAEGKRDLADAVRQAVSKKTRDACGHAEQLGRTYGEGRIEVFVAYLEVIGGYERGEHYDGLLDRALAVVARTSELGLCLGAERICYYEWVVSLLDGIDLPGHAAEILAVVDDMDARLPASEECRTCFLPRRGRCLEVSGDLAGAEEVYRAQLTRASEPRKRVSLLLDLADLSCKRGHLREAETHIDRAAGEVEQIDDRTKVDLRIGSSRVLLATARGSLDDASRACDELLTRAEPWDFNVLDAELSLAERLAAEHRPTEAARRAARCAARAEARGGRRRHAEALLIAAEALVANGQRAEARGQVEELEKVVPRLKSGDLDDRARAVGARIEERPEPLRNPARKQGDPLEAP
jgi:hypothetical protein